VKEKITQMCSEWTSLHTVRKALEFHNDKGGDLLRIVQRLVKDGHLEHRGGVAGVKHTGMPQGQYQIRRKQLEQKGQP
jgi:hypothetical protein